MNKLKEKINKIPKPYFSVKDLEKIADMKKESVKVFVSRAVKNGELVKLGKSFYTNDINSFSWENFAVNVYAPSYISFEFALNYYGILSQQTSAITLATIKRKKEIKILEKSLIYRHIKPDLFWGYKKVENFLIAEPEKAFLDLAYLSLNGYAKFDSEEMNLDLLDKKKTKHYLKKISMAKLDKLISNIL